MVRLAATRRGRGTPGWGSAMVVCLMLNRWLRRSACEREPTIANGFAFVGSALLVPPFRQLCSVEVAERLSLADQLSLHRREPFSETPACDTKRVLGVDLQPARQRHHGEQQVAKLVEHRGRILRLGDLAPLLRDGPCAVARGRVL